MSIIKVSKHQDGLDYNFVAEGNKTIGIFMGEFIHKLEYDKYYWLAKNYRIDWNEIMAVVRKIKSIVYKDGYDIFSKKHGTYIAICNNCYDCDIEGVWNACIKWIDTYYKKPQIESFQNIVYSKNIIKLFRDKVYLEEEDVIIKVFDNIQLLKSYVNGGDGLYELKGYPNCFVKINDFVIVDIVNKNKD